MNVQGIRTKLNDLKQDIKKIWQKDRAPSKNSQAEEDRVMHQEEKLDEELDESFPASDPPGHFSKSLEDKELH